MANSTSNCPTLPNRRVFPAQKTTQARERAGWYEERRRPGRKGTASIPSSEVKTKRKPSYIITVYAICYLGIVPPSSLRGGAGNPKRWFCGQSASSQSRWSHSRSFIGRLYFIQVWPSRARNGYPWAIRYYLPLARPEVWGAGGRLYPNFISVKTCSLRCAKLNAIMISSAWSVYVPIIAHILVKSNPPEMGDCFFPERLCYYYSKRRAHHGNTRASNKKR